MEQEFEPEPDDSIISAVTDEHRSRMLSDPIYRLQHEKEDQIKALSSKERLTALQDIQDEYFKEDSIKNSNLRKLHRLKRIHDRELLDEGRKRQMSIPLVDPHPNDDDAARRVSFKSKKGAAFNSSVKAKRITLLSQPILNQTGKNTSLKRKDYLSSALKKQIRLSIKPSDFTVKREFPSPTYPAVAVTAKVMGESSSLKESSLDLLSQYGEQNDE